MQKGRQALLQYLKDNNVTIEEATTLLKNPAVKEELLHFLPAGFYERLVGVAETLQQETMQQETQVPAMPNVGISASSIPRVRLLPINK